MWIRNREGGGRESEISKLIAKGKVSNKKLGIESSESKGFFLWK